MPNQRSAVCSSPADTPAARGPEQQPATTDDLATTHERQLRVQQGADLESRLLATLTADDVLETLILPRRPASRQLPFRGVVQSEEDAPSSAMTTALTVAGTTYQPFDVSTIARR